MTEGGNKRSKSEKQLGWNKMSLKQKYLVGIWRENLERQIVDNERILEIDLSVVAAVCDGGGLMVSRSSLDLPPMWG